MYIYIYIIYICIYIYIYIFILHTHITWMIFFHYYSHKMISSPRFLFLSQICSSIFINWWMHTNLWHLISIDERIWHYILYAYILICSMFSDWHLHLISHPTSTFWPWEAPRPHETGCSATWSQVVRVPGAPVRGRGIWCYNTYQNMREFLYSLIFLAFYLANILTFYLTNILTFNLA